MSSYAYLGDENLTNLATFLDASRGGERATESLTTRSLGPAVAGGERDGAAPRRS